MGADMEVADNVVAINEQKVVELEIRNRQLERSNAQLLIEKLQNEMLAIENASTYFRERMPHLQQELAAAHAKFTELTRA